MILALILTGTAIITAVGVLTVAGAERTDRQHQTGGRPVVKCPKCGAATAYDKCWNCGHKHTN